MSYQGFPLLAVKLILCPHDGGELNPSVDDEFIMAGELSCKLCGRRYRLEQGIVRLDEFISHPVMKDEVVARDEEAVNYDARLSPRYFREIVPILNQLGSVDGKKVLEYGAGTGRLTTELAGAALVLAVDFSLSSLKILASKKLNSPLALVCGDATQVKFKGQEFAVVVATQLIEHLPGSVLRRQFYERVKDHLQPAGCFLASVYHHHLRRRLKRLAPEGKHEGGIFYHYFTMVEWRTELTAVFPRVKIGYLDLVWPFLSRFNLSPRLEGWLSALGVKLPLIRQLAYLLYVKAQ